MLTTNVIETANLIKSAAKTNINRIIIVGTCHEYGHVNDCLILLKLILN